MGKQSQMWQNTLILTNLHYIEKLMGQVNLAGMRYRISVSFLSWILHLKFFLQKNLRKRKKEGDNMNKSRFMTPQEREVYCLGYNNDGTKNMLKIKHKYFQQENALYDETIRKIDRCLISERKKVFDI